MDNRTAHLVKGAQMNEAELRAATFETVRLSTSSIASIVHGTVSSELRSLSSRFLQVFCYG
jgi:hypothetical protein